MQAVDQRAVNGACARGRRSLQLPGRQVESAGMSLRTRGRGGNQGENYEWMGRRALPLLRTGGCSEDARWRKGYKRRLPTRAHRILWAQIAELGHLARAGAPQVYARAQSHSEHVERRPIHQIEVEIILAGHGTRSSSGVGQGKRSTLN